MAKKRVILEQLDVGLLSRIRREPRKIIKSKRFYQPAFKRRMTTFLADFSLQTMPKFSYTVDEDTEVDKADLEARSFEAKHERDLFLAYNYCKWRLAKLMRDVNGQAIAKSKAEEIKYWFEKIIRIREFLAAVHMRLSIAMAKRSRVMGVDFADLVAEGNGAIFRTIDRFDAERGFRYSTYACRAILSQFNRERNRAARYMTRYKVMDNPETLDTEFRNHSRNRQSTRSIEELRSALEDPRSMLTPNQKNAVMRYYGLDGSGLTLEKLGKEMGLSKERIRQLVDKALTKIGEAIKDRRRALPIGDKNIN